MKHYRFVASLFVTLFLSAAIAAPEALPLRHALRIKDYSGSTFLYAMTVNNGIKDNFDEDYKQSYRIASWPTIEKALENFDKKIVKRVMSSFDGREGFKKFSQSIAGESFKPSTIDQVIRRHYDGPGNIYVLAHFYAMASGAGTLVRIDEENYYYNFGYKEGDHPDDVKSGRSYGATPLHNANDASDVMYLDELEHYFRSEENPSVFFEVFLSILTQCDVSGYRQLSEEGQAAMTDLVAIYTAELNRHLMVNLNNAKHPWENDLAEATFMAAYTTQEGKIMKDGKLTFGRMRNYWAMSEVSNRSGIGITRTDRRKLQRLISRYIRTHHDEISKDIDRLVGRRSDGDLFRALTEYLNNFRTQSEVRRDAKRIVDTYTNLLIVIQNESSEITETIERWD